MKHGSLPALKIAMIFGAIAPTLLWAQQSPPPSQQAQQRNVEPRSDFGNRVGGAAPSVFMQVPISNLSPGAVPSRPTIKNPAQGDPHATERGMKYFISFNCVGCHADNGGGGMGPAFSTNNFTYGGQPENIYLSIFQGRPNGMPAWGAMLPESVIWDLVTYVSKLSNEPLSPKVEQVPTEQVTTSDPWSSTKNFSSGQKP